MSGYAALWCKSNYSFLEGASDPGELVAEAHRLGLQALALTDRDGVYGIVRAHVKARELGLALIVGAQVTLDDGARVVSLARDRAGYANLCQLLTRGRMRSPKGSCSVTWRELCEHASGTIALLGADAFDEERDAPFADLREAFGDALYVALARHRRAEEVDVESATRARARRLDLPVVACSEVLYHHAQRRRLQDVLTCIRRGTTLFEAGAWLAPNAEHDLKTPHAFGELFADDPAAIERTLEIAQRCRFSLAQLRYRYPSERLPDGRTSAQWLRELTEAGALRRYPDGVPPKVRAQIGKELELIEELDYCGYFLTMWEIVEYCKTHDILCQGRGSAANSVVCFCLGITAVDPLRIDLLFERFLSRERAEPPDIDLDIEHQRREEVIQHVYGKYKRSHAAMVANVVCYRPRSALRDVGKALGLAPDTLDRIAKVCARYSTVDAELCEQAEVAVDPRALRRWLEFAGQIQGFPRHLSIHPGGFLLGHEPIATLVPIEPATLKDRTVIQWDKDDLEAIGLFKVDLLALGALTHLHGAFELLKRHCGLDLSLADFKEHDPATYAMIGRAETVGVFQIESRAQMAMLPRLLPTNYYDLVIEISIVRPGPITGGMVHPYLRRRKGLEKSDAPHACIETVLAKTLGVPLFQEQVMRLAIVAADYTPGEADQLRRDMAAWRKTGRIEQHRERLVAGMQRNGIPVEFAERVFRQIKGFGEYGFPESHAASFALISYVGAWLKCHHAAAFTCALLNAQPMGFYSISTIIEDAKRHGVRVRPIEICASSWDATLEPDGRGWAVRMGLRFVHGLKEIEGQRIRDALSRARPRDVQELARVARLEPQTLAYLAEAGALDKLQRQRRPALWAATGWAGQDRFDALAHELGAARFERLGSADLVVWDHERTGHSTRGHQLAEWRPRLAALGLPDARTLAAWPNGRWVQFAGAVICRQCPQTASGVLFMTLEDETGWVNVIVRKPVFEHFATLIKGRSFLGITGRLQSREGVTHLLADEFWIMRLPYLRALVVSHDFQ